MAGSQHSSTFKPFSALNDDAANFPGANFAETVADAAAGMDALLRLIEDSNLGEDGDVPFLSPCQQFELFRLMKATTRLLQERAHDQVEWANTYGAKWVRAGAFRESTYHGRREPATA